MRRLSRILFNAVTVLSLLLFAATVALWVRSYWRSDGFGVCAAQVQWPWEFARVLTATNLRTHELVQKVPEYGGPKRLIIGPNLLGHGTNLLELFAVYVPIPHA